MRGGREPVPSWLVHNASQPARTPTSSTAVSTSPPTSAKSRGDPQKTASPGRRTKHWLAALTLLATECSMRALSPEKARSGGEGVVLRNSAASEIKRASSTSAPMVIQAPKAA
eukprot:2388860-Rhodomonas_salina.1